MRLFVRQIACLTKSEGALLGLGVSYSHKSPAEGSIVAPPQVASFFFFFSFFSKVYLNQQARKRHPSEEDVTSVSNTSVAAFKYY